MNGPKESEWMMTHFWKGCLITQTNAALIACWSANMMGE